MGALGALAAPALIGVILLALGTAVPNTELAEGGALLFVLGLAFLAITSFACNLF